MVASWSHERTVPGSNPPQAEVFQNFIQFFLLIEEQLSMLKFFKFWLSLFKAWRRRGTLGNERKTFRSSPSLLGTERKTFCSSPRVFPSPPSILELTPKVYRPIGWQKSDAKGQRVSCHIRVWTSSDNGEIHMKISGTMGMLKSPFSQ